MRAGRGGRGLAGFGRKVSGAAVTVALACASTAGLLALDASVAAADPPVAPNLFVAKTGNDAANNCANSLTPCLTIAKALSVAVDNASTIQVGAGTYVEKPSITKRVTILGAGSGPTGTVIDGGGAGIVVTSNPGGTTNLVTIDGVRITRGNSTVGGAWVVTGRLDLKNSVVTANTGSSLGGGILVYNGMSLNLTNTDVTNNTAQQGGGIMSLGAGPVTITGGTISGNTASIANGAGGGIVVTTCAAATCGSAKPAGSINIANATIANNTANSFGGGLYSLGAATISNTAFNQNKETVVGGTGGGGAVFGAASSITGSSFTGNTGVLGGAIWTTAGLTLTNTNFTSNASNDGGAIYQQTGSLSVTGGTFATNTSTGLNNNVATGFGGAIYNAAAANTLSVNGTTFTGNKALTGGNQLGNGGAIASVGPTTIATSTFDTNSATGFGGGAYLTNTTAMPAQNNFNTNTALVGGGIANTGALTATGIVVDGNTSNLGGGVYNSGTASFTNGEIRFNVANAISGNTSSGFGGGIYSQSAAASALVLNGAHVGGNKAVAAGTQIGSGGGIYSANTNATGTTISNNSIVSVNEATNGAGLYAAGPTSITSSTVTLNKAIPTSAANGFGGGIYATSTLTTNGANVTSNTAANGGGIYNVANSGKVTITGGSVSFNTVTAVPSGASTGLGGGIYSANFTAPVGLAISGVSISGNAAKSAGSGATLVAGQAGGIYHFAITTIGSSNFDGNTADGNAGAIYNAAGTIALTDTPFSGNSAPGVGGSILDAAASVSGANTMTFVNSPIAGAGTSFLGGGLAIGAASKVDIQGGSITGGKASSGGGVFVAQTGANATSEPGGQLTMDDTDVTGNSTTTGGLGGGIASGGKVTASDGEISNNSAPGTANGTGLGAGVYSASAPNGSQANPAPAELTLSRMTIAGNGGNGGTAIAATGPTALRNSTVNGNAATSTAGAIAVSGATTLSNDTIVGNTAGAGTGSTGGIARLGGTTTVTGSIVAQNGGNCFGTIVDGGYNLTDTVSPAAGACAFTSNSVVGDPQLNALGNNGGPTPTMLPKNNSPAINKIPSPNAACPATDQRGVLRPQGASCDIGSVELEGIVAPTLNGPDHALFIVGTPNSVGFTYTGVPKPTLSTTGDALPSGVTLTDNNDGTATLGGTAATGTAGVYHFTIKAASGEPPDATINFTLTVIAPLTITTTSLPDGEVSVPYNSSVQATGGTTPYTWSVSAGSLPAGLNLNTSSGAITGTPTGPEGPSNFTVEVVDSTGEVQQSATKALAISIKTATTLSANPAILHVALPLLRLSIINASATLTKAPGNQPVAGQSIRFVAGAQQLCVAVTDANGFAKCPPTNVSGILAVLLANGYNAYFDGDATLKPSSGHGGLVSG